jgi:hypothetical protein
MSRGLQFDSEISRKVESLYLTPDVVGVALVPKAAVSIHRCRCPMSARSRQSVDEGHSVFGGRYLVGIAKRQPGVRTN